MPKDTTVFEAFTRLKVLVVGDVMVDRYLSGTVDRISPEAPVPIVHLQRNEERLGGAANVILNIQALGAQPFLCTVIGRDAIGDRFMDLMSEGGLMGEGVIRSADRPTTIKTRIMAGKQQLLRVDEENTDDLTESESEALCRRAGDLMDRHQIDLVLFQDYNKGVLTLLVIDRLMDECRRRGIPTAVDPKYKNFWAYRKVTLFKPNLKEIRAQLPMALTPDLESLEAAAAFVREKLDNRYTLVTLSELGLFIDDRGRSKIIGTKERKVADVSGAGDTVISIAAMGLAIDADMAEIAGIANLAGGQVCERLGVVPVDRERLIEEYKTL